jgi:hypothetical protein
MQSRGLGEGGGCGGWVLDSGDDAFFFSITLKPVVE